MNVHAEFGLPTLIENLVLWSRQEKDPITQSRLQTIATLCFYIENDERWYAILRHEVNL